MASLDFEPGRNPRDRTFLSHPWHPGARDPEPVTPRFSDPGVRTYDPDLCCWVLAPVVLPVKSRPAPAVTPISDGSGVRWEVRDDHGQPLWAFEAGSFDRALVEKRRLCQAVGGRSGWARLYPVGD